MKLKTLSAAIALSLCSVAAVANTYQGEIGADFGQMDLGSVDADLLTIKGDYFFNAVDTSNKPLAEAAFLQEAGGVHAAFAQLDADGYETSSTGVSIDHYFGDSIFYAAATLLSWDQEEDGEPDFSDDTWGVTAGVTPVAGWLLTTTYWDDIDYEFNLQSKYVTQLQGDTAINFELGYADGGDEGEDTVTAGLDYYFNHNASLGVFTEDAEETTSGIRGRYFFNDKFSANASFATGDDVDTTMVGVALRF